MVSTVNYEGDLAAVKQARPTTEVTYWFIVDPMAHSLHNVIKVFFSAFLRDVERFGIDDMTGILVQGLQGNVWVPLCETPTIVADESYLWGICVGHRDGVIEGELLCGFGDKLDPQTQGYISHIQTHTLRF